MTFDPASVPAGAIVRLVPFWRERPIITPRSLLTHTMAASKRSSVAGAWNHTNADPGTNTLPHYALGMDAADGCAKFLPTNRRGIANATVTTTTRDGRGRLVWPTLTDDERASITAHGNIRNWSLAIETADTGTDDDPAISAFTDYQVEMLVRILVHELAGWRIPPAPLGTWWATGVATHTEPFEFPYTTLFPGKFCPGAKKKAQFWTLVLPEVVARLAPPPPPPAPPIGDPDVLDYRTEIAAIWSAPPAANVTSGKPLPDGTDPDRWLSVVIAKLGPLSGVQARAGLKATGLYDPATEAACNAELAAMRATAGV